MKVKISLLGTLQTLGELFRQSEWIHNHIYRQKSACRKRALKDGSAQKHFSKSGIFSKTFFVFSM